MSYLIHFNKNHSKANGQFISGDGDGDGIVNDHSHRSSNKNNVTQTSDRYSKQDWKNGIKITAAALGTVAAITGIAAAGYSFYQKNKSHVFSEEELDEMGINYIKLNRIDLNYVQPEYIQPDYIQPDYIQPDYIK